ncbi:hypothetical protein [Halochromatium glycolicum]|uniref:hypothetical protein n=1 Tax=Halochromatium glycolicum TaxID=85075 RepID=UPI001F5B5E76|nr:hypothetical protein [Halochromatium glycolicum]
MIQHAWVNYATQFNWALTQLDAETDWVLRLDADEYLTPALVAEIQARLPHIGPETDGLYCGRRMTLPAPAGYCAGAPAPTPAPGCPAPPLQPTIPKGCNAPPSRADAPSVPSAERLSPCGSLRHLIRHRRRPIRGPHTHIDASAIRMWSTIRNCPSTSYRFAGQRWVITGK